MSLINKLLDDLETRQAYNNEDHDNVLVGLSSSHDFRSDEPDYSRVFPLIKILFLLAVFAAAIYQLQLRYSFPQASDLYTFIGEDSKDSEHERRPLSDVGTLQLDTNLSFPEAEIASAANVSHLQQIAFEKTLDGITVLLKLSHASSYQVYSLHEPNRIIIELDQSSLSFPVEQLEPEIPFNRVRAEQLDDGKLRLTLESENTLKIDTISMESADSVHQLYVSVFQDIADQFVENTDAVPDVNSAAVPALADNTNTKVTVFKGEVIKTPAKENNVSLAEDIFRQALSDYHANRYAESISQLQAILEIDPLHVKARTMIAMIYFKRGDSASAISFLQNGLNQLPEEIEWITLNAKILLHQGSLLSAANQLNKVTPGVDGNADYYAIKAAVQQRLGNHKVAARFYRDLLKFDATNAAYWMGLAISLEALDRYSDALYAYEQAMTKQTLVGQSRDFVRDRFKNLTAMINDKSS